MIECLALAQAVVLGYLVVRVWGPLRGLRPAWAAAMAEVALGIGAGAAVTATGFFFLLWLGLAQRAVVCGWELAAILGLAVLAWRSRKAPGANLEEAPARPGWRWNKMLLAALGLALLLVILAQVDTARLSPYGEFDAFAMWNARAKFLLGPGHTWQRAFSPLLERQRPDHPLLLSAFIARTWRLGGDAASPAASFGAAMLFFYGTLGLLASGLTLLRGLSSALLGCLLLLADTSLLTQSTWQYADIPLSLYFLGAIVLLLVSATATGRRWAAALAASGAFASFATMTKNEGIPFLLLLLAAFLAVEWRAGGFSGAWRSGRIWLAGALPGALLEGAFKLLLAPTGGPFAGPSLSQALAFLAQPGRYLTVASYLGSKVLALGSGLAHPFVLVGILALVLRFQPDARLKPHLAAAAATLGLLLLVYCGVYLTTLDNLQWRLDTSLGRLYSQLWPSLMLLFFLVLGQPRDPEAARAVGDAKKKAAPARRRGKKKRRARSGTATPDAR